MVRAQRVCIALFAFLVLLNLTRRGEPTLAAEESEQPKRQSTIVTKYTQYEWWLSRWTDNLFVCQIFTDHEGLPSDGEVLRDCGDTIFEQWKTTPPCLQAEKGKSTFPCLGLYVHFISYKDSKKDVVVDLPPAKVFVSISGCDLSPPKNFCPQIPKLLLTGEEPLPDEQITAIHVLINGQELTCDGNTCEIPLQSTPLAGTPIEFWADSSFGDSSEHFTALVRVIESGVPATPGENGWYVDVLSTQWQGSPVDSCAATWQSFLPPGGPPAWISTPQQTVLLASDEPFQYLAGRLIFQGLVDASECANGGLLANGYADACGLSAARPLVEAWQNQFNSRILEVAQETNLPAQLMKNLFAQESQFWPGVFRVPLEFGLGQITDLGADTVLLWNQMFYDAFCPTVLSKEACAKGYLRLSDEQRAILRGALAIQANADCPNCPTGVDLSTTNDSIMLFAQGILANCNQVGQTISNITQLPPGSVSSYEDLWRFTLANYNGGPGCLAFAIYTTWAFREPMDWEHVSSHLTIPCQGVISYVDLISR